MATEWTTYRLDDVCEFINGFAFKSTDYVAQSDDTIEVFRMGYIKRGGGFKEDNSPVFVPKTYDRDLRKFMLRTGDIAIAMTDMKDRVAILGNTARIRETNRFVLNQRVGCIRVKRPDLVHPRFLYYLSNWLPHVEHLRTRANRGVQVNLSTSEIKNVEFCIPPLPDQVAIGNILGSLDDKIDLNESVNITLEAIARALFKSWFIDFDPVRAKMAGGDPGLPKHLADLFPDSLEHSELAERPKGWALTPVGELADVVGGSTPSTKEPNYWNGTHHWATPKDLSSLTIPVLLNTERSISDEGLAQISSGLLPPGTLLLSSRAPIGYLAISEVPVAINQGFIAMKARENVSNLFLLFWIKFSHDTIVSRANGSTFLEISKANFRPIPVISPTSQVMAAFDAQVRPLYNRMVANERENRTLADLRDALLPKLISGELRVKASSSLVNQNESRRL